MANAFDLDSFIAQYYRQAVITACWAVSKSQSGNSTLPSYRELIYASIEFIPNYFGCQFGEDETQLKQPRGIRIFHVRHIMSAPDGLAWYRNACSYGYMEMPWDAPNKRIEYNPELSPDHQMLSFPALPLTFYADRLPFIGKCWWHAQCGHYLPTSDAKNILGLLKCEDVRTWIEEHLCFDLGNYPEYVGSVNLIMPNPYYCHSHMKRVSGVNGGLANQVDLKFDQNCSSAGLRVIYAQRVGNGEFTVVGERQVTQQTERFDIVDVEAADGYIVVDSYGRVVDMMNFAPIVTMICGHIGCVNGYAEFVCKDNKRQVVPKVRHSGLTVKSPFPRSAFIELSDRLRACEADREARKIERVQQLYFKNAGDAERQIRTLINGAVDSVLIIDSYFSADTASMYLAAANAPVTVLTSNSDVRDGDKSRKRLLAKINSLRAMGMSVDVWLNTQHQLHDRFLVVDNTVWLLGSSLKTLGDSLSMMIKLDDSTRRARWFWDFFKTIGKKRLGDWVASHA